MTPKEAAEWMLEELNRVRWLDQETVAWKIVQIDKSLVYDNENGNLALKQSVLSEFQKLTANTVVWSRSEKHWRLREPYDTPGKRMQD